MKIPPPLLAYEVLMLIPTRVIEGELRYSYPPWVLRDEVYYPALPSVNIEFAIVIDAHWRYREFSVLMLWVLPIDESAILIVDVTEST